jgi:hypothetical protein
MCAQVNLHPKGGGFSIFRKSGGIFRTFVSWEDCATDLVKRLENPTKCLRFVFLFLKLAFFFFGFLLMFYQLPEVYTAQGGRKRTIKDYEDPKWKQGYDPNAVAIEVINLETVKRMHIT